MKQILLTLLTLLSLQVYPQQVDTSVSFDFTDPVKLPWNPAVTSIPDGSGDLVNVTNYTLSDGPVVISFGVGSGNAGAAINHSGNYNTLSLRKWATISFNVSNGCQLSSIQFTGSSVMTLPSDQPGTWSYISGKWNSNSTNVTSVTFENGYSTDARFSKIVVNYKRPSTPLNLYSTNPSNNETLESFSSMELRFNMAATLVSSSGITISGTGIEGSKEMNVLASGGNTATLSISPAITIDGNYTISVPAGAFKNSEGATNQAFTRTFTIQSDRKTVKYTSVSPNEGSYSVLPQSIILSYDGYVTLSNDASVSVKKNGQLQFSATVSLGADQKSVVLSHSRGEITDEGVWTFEIPEGTIHNGFLGNDANDRWNPAFVLNYVVERQESAEMKKAKQLLLYSGIGYPTSNSSARTALQSIVDKGENATIEELQQAIDDFYSETEIEMPVDGKWYKIIGTNASGNKMAYLTYTNGSVKLSTVDNYYCKFQAQVNGNNYVFKTADDKFLTVLTNTEYSGANPNNVTSTSGKANQLSLAKLVITDGNKDQLLGKLSITGWLGRDADDNDQGNSFIAINHSSLSIVDTPTTTLYFDEDISSAFIFVETTEPIDESQMVEPEGSFVHHEIEHAGDELILVISNVRSATISNDLLPYFGQHGEKVDFSETILSSSDKVCQFKVNTTGLPVGDYNLIIPEGTFSYVAESTEKIIKDREIVVDFTIKSESGNNPPDDPTDDPTPSVDFSETYESVGFSLLSGIEKAIDYYADVDLNDFIIFTYVPSYYSDLVCDKSKTVSIIDGYLGAPIRSGHFESYNDFKKDFPSFASGRKAIRLILDSPFKAGDLKTKSGLYAVSIPAATFGDANFGKYLNNPSSVEPSNCRVNKAMVSSRYEVNNAKAETTAIQGIKAENGEQRIYDLTGRRVTVPVKGGLYIINGRKVIMK